MGKSDTTEYRFENERKKTGSECVPGVLLWLSKRLRKMKWSLLNVKTQICIRRTRWERFGGKRQDLTCSDDGRHLLPAAPVCLPPIAPTECDPLLPSA